MGRARAGAGASGRTQQARRDDRGAQPSSCTQAEDVHKRFVRDPGDVRRSGVRGAAERRMARRGLSPKGLVNAGQRSVYRRAALCSYAVRRLGVTPGPESETQPGGMLQQWVQQENQGHQLGCSLSCSSLPFSSVHLGSRTRPGLWHEHRRTLVKASRSSS